MCTPRGGGHAQRPAQRGVRPGRVSGLGRIQLHAHEQHRRLALHRGQRPTGRQYSWQRGQLGADGGQERHRLLVRLRLAQRHPGAVADRRVRRPGDRVPALLARPAAQLADALGRHRDADGGVRVDGDAEPERQPAGELPGRGDRAGHSRRVPDELLLGGEDRDITGAGQLDGRQVERLTGWIGADRQRDPHLTARQHLDHPGRRARVPDRRAEHLLQLVRRPPSAGRRLPRLGPRGRGHGKPLSLHRSRLLGGGRPTGHCPAAGTAPTPAERTGMP